MDKFTGSFDQIKTLKVSFGNPAHFGRDGWRIKTRVGRKKPLGSFFILTPPSLFVMMNPTGDLVDDF
jgi:hypothetical protein